MKNNDEKTALGIILGAAVGDALGAPLEFLEARDPDDFVTEMVGGGLLKWNPGEITDDTIMSLSIQEMYLEKGRYDQQTIISKWLDWKATDPKDIGNWTHKVLNAWERVYCKEELRGDDSPSVQLWADTGHNSAGNGSLMRCMPTVIVHRNNGLLFISDTVKLSEDTHPDPRCVLSCIAVNNILRLGFLGYSKVDALIETIKLISNLSTESTRPIIGAIRVIEAISNATTLEWELWSNDGYVIDTLQCAIAAWYQNDSFEEGLVKVVNRGKDADTVGAIAGALLGAYHGIDSIPTKWIDALSEKNKLINNTIGLLKIGKDNTNG